MNNSQPHGNIAQQSHRRPNEDESHDTHPGFGTPSRDPVDTPSSSSTSTTSAPSFFPTSETTSKREKLRILGSRTKARAKQVLSLDGALAARPQRSAVVTHDALGSLDDDPAFNPDEVAARMRDVGGDGTRHVPNHDSEVLNRASIAMHKLGGELKTVGLAIAQPKKSAILKAKREVAGNIAAVPQSVVGTSDADIEFVEANAELEQAKKDLGARGWEAGDMGGDGEGGGNEGVEGHYEDELERCQNRVQEMEELRDKLRVGWATTHVHRVRVVRIDRYQWPDSKDYMEVDKQTGKPKHFSWQPWIMRVLLFGFQRINAQYLDDFDEVPLDVEVLRGHLERLAVVSAPWQMFFMEVRHVYRWDDPPRTLRWLILYIFLWQTQHMVVFIWLSVIWIVLRDRFFPKSAESFKQDLQRAKNHEQGARHLGEMLDKYGAEDLFSSLQRGLGPQAQLQLGDLANILEVFANFREWKHPARTWQTLAVFGAGVLVSIFGDWILCAKIIEFLAGATFFFSFPVSSRFPEYRYAASPFKIIWWDVPTHAEWAFSYLREQARLGRLAVFGKVRADTGELDAETEESEQTVGEKLGSQQERELKLEKHLDAKGHTNAHSDGHGSTISANGVDPRIDNAISPSPIPQATSPVNTTPNVGNAGQAQALLQHGHPSGKQAKAESPETPSSTLLESTLSSVPILSFRATHGHQRGRLVIYSSRVSFLGRGFSADAVAWSIPFAELEEMRKLETEARKDSGAVRKSLRRKAVSSGDRLALKALYGDERVLKLPSGGERDKCFNCLLGFSGLRWQSMQGGPKWTAGDKRT